MRYFGISLVLIGAALLLDYETSQLYRVYGFVPYIAMAIAGLGLSLALETKRRRRR